MFDSIRKMFRKSSADPDNPATSPAQTPAPASLEPASAQSDSPFPAPAFAAAASAQESLRIPLSALVKMMPKELHGNFSPSDLPKLHVSVPTQKVVGQIAGGVVRLRLIELRRAAPVGAFTNNTEYDQRLVDLPLEEILKQLPPEALARRDQKKVEISVGDTDYFGPRDKNAAPAAVPPWQQTPVPPRPPRPSAPPTLGTKPSPLARPKEASAVSDLPATSAALSPVALGPRPPESSISLAETTRPISSSDTVGVTLAELARAWPEALRQELKQTNLLQARCELPISELSAALKQGKVQFPWKHIRSWVASPPSADSPVSPHSDTLLELPLKIIAPLYLARHRSLARAQSHRQVTPAADIPDVFTRQTAGAPPSQTQQETAGEVSLSETPPSGTLPSSSKGFVSLPIAAISQTWPPPVRKQISYLNLADAKLEVPLEAIEAGLKVGKVDYLWKQICAWIRPTPPPSFWAEHGEARLELPLHILAPLYLQYQPPRAEPAPEPDGITNGADAAAREASPRGGLTSTVDLRSPFSSAAATAQLTPPEATAASRSQVSDETSEPPAEARKTPRTPDEVVHETTRLPGVTGSLVALQDGLLVAGCMPPPWRAETIAAFLAQVFGRMNPYGQEFGLGSLSSVSLTGDHGTLHVCKAGNIFFATLAKPGAQLPLAHLQSLAREVSRQTA